MIRRLFFQEFIRDFTKAFLWACAAVAFLMGSFYTAARVDETPNLEVMEPLFTSMVALMAAAAYGVNTFSRAFRDGPLRLLDVLPIGRFWIWAIRVFTGFVSAATISILPLIANPTLIAILKSPRGVTVIAAWILLFAVGCCISTISASSAAGTGGLTVGTVGLIFALLAVVQAYMQRDIAIPSPTGFIVDVITGLALPLLALLLSLVVFMRGEMDVFQRRWRNWASAALLLAASLVLSLAAIDAGVFEAGTPWKASAFVEASPNGAYFSAVQFQGRNSPVFRVAIIEAATGNIAKTYKGNGWAGQAWTEDNTLIVFTKNSALRFVAGVGSHGVSATRVFPGEQRLFHRSGVRLVEAASNPGGPMAVLETPSLSTPEEQTLVRFDRQGQAHDLLHLPQAGAYGFIEGSHGNLLISYNTNNGKFWRIHDDVVEFPFELGHFRFSTRGAMQKAVEKLTAGVPRFAGSHPQVGKYLRSDSDLNFDNDSWLYYIEGEPESHRGRVLARRNGDAEWKEIVRDLPLNDSQLRALGSKNSGLFAAGFYPELAAAGPAGMITYLATSQGEPRLRVVDASTGEQFDMGNIGTGPEFHQISISSKLHSQAIVTVYQGVQRSKVIPKSFLYRPGQGAPIRIDSARYPWRITLAADSGVAFWGQQQSDATWQFFYLKPPAAARVFEIP